MNLKGKKTILRAIEKEDMDFLRDMINDEDLERNVVGWSFPVSKYEQERWFENQIQNKDSIRYIIEADDKAIGLVNLVNIDWKNRKAGNGIKLYNNEVKRKGYGTDVVRTIMKYAFEELQLNRLYCNILKSNEASINLYKKCGWKIEGIKEESVFKNNTYIDELVLGVLKKDYEKIKKEWEL